MHLITNLLSSSVSLIATFVIIMLMAFVAFALLVSIDKGWNARWFIVSGTLAFLGLAGMSIRLFDIWLALGERQIWGFVGAGLFGAGLFLTVSLIFSLKKAKTVARQKANGIKTPTKVP